MLLNNQQVKEKNKEKLENVLPNDNKNTSQNLWEQLKKFLEEVYYIKMLILDKSHKINYLSCHLKKLQKNSI